MSDIPGADARRREQERQWAWVFRAGVILVYDVRRVKGG